MSIGENRPPVKPTPAKPRPANPQVIRIASGNGPIKRPPTKRG